MLRWAGTAEVPESFGPCVVTIGVFDGVHLGHATLIREAVDRAKRAGVPAVVITFDPNPVAVLRPDAAPTVLATLEHRLDLIEALGVDATLVLTFELALAQETPEEFVDLVLVGAVHAREVVVGEGFRFGRRAAGDVALLQELGSTRGFTASSVVRVGDDEGLWSSTRVRAAVAAGDMEVAARALGRLHRVEGVVVHGDARGRTIGYPTANLELPPRTAIPSDGVYAGWLGWSQDRLPAAVSIGTNPTFDGLVRRVEAYVLDRDDLELYGEHVAIDVLLRLRDTLRFDSVDELVSQMGHDCDRARALTA